MRFHGRDFSFRLYNKSCIRYLSWSQELNQNNFRRLSCIYTNAKWNLKFWLHYNGLINTDRNIYRYLNSKIQEKIVKGYSWRIMFGILFHNRKYRTEFLFPLSKISKYTKCFSATRDKASLIHTVKKTNIFQCQTMMFWQCREMF